MTNLIYDTIVFYNTEICEEGIPELIKDKEFYMKKIGDHNYLFVPISCTHSKSYEIVRNSCEGMTGRRLILLYSKNETYLYDLKRYLKSALILPYSIGAYIGKYHIDQNEIKNYFNF